MHMVADIDKSTEIQRQRQRQRQRDREAVAPFVEMQSG